MLANIMTIGSGAVFIAGAIVAILCVQGILDCNRKYIECSTSGYPFDGYFAEEYKNLKGRYWLGICLSVFGMGMSGMGFIVFWSMK